ncbi:MAG: T9SS type A sorting domain-containing protein [Bacteroidales bacterium]|jgi:hypothetical protein|nr:T9SS type A sorting domain-containing protein [Bacteroidales bacterium]
MIRKALPLLFLLSIFLFPFTAQSQTYIYKLSENFMGNVVDAPPLVQIPNNSGLTGEFVTRSVPSTTCEEGGTAGGYFFEDDAGLQFNCPEGFITESYSLSFIFQFDEFISPPAWVRILSFTHTDDHGMYIYLTNSPTNGTLEFWPFGTAGATDFFDTENFYQLILVRDNSGLIKIYVNGTEFAEYDDSMTQEYKFHDPDNYLIFFRDHPSVLADEASPGFVSNIKITNNAWTTVEVEAEWEDFCASLLGIPETAERRFQLYPNPAGEKLNITFYDDHPDAELNVIDLSGKVLLKQYCASKNAEIDISSLPQGIYFLRIMEKEANRVVKFIKE